MISLARLIAVGSIQHVPLNFSGLGPVHCLDPLRFDPVCLRHSKPPPRLLARQSERIKNTLASL